MKNVILAAFGEKCTSPVIIAKKAKTDCTKLVLPCDEKSLDALCEAIKKVNAVCVVMLGEKPRIKDKIAVEPAAKRKAETLRTPLDCRVTAEKLRENGCDAYISKGFRKSCCNHIYYNCLETEVNCIFLNVPASDNITDIAAVTKAVEKYISQLDSVPCML